MALPKCCGPSACRQSTSSQARADDHSDGESCPPVSMNALRSAAAFRHVRVPRVHVTPCHRSQATACWHRSTVRLAPYSNFYISPGPDPLNSRAFRHFAQQENEKSVPTAPAHVAPATPKVAIVSNAEQRRRDWAIVRRLAVHIWPKNDWGTRGRVVLGVGLLVSGKVRLSQPSCARLVRLISSLHSC